MKDAVKSRTSVGPAGGWGSVRSLFKSILRDRVPFSAPRVLLKQNKTDGFMCVSCAWAKPADPRVFEFCENGAKATTWEITSKRVTPKFFAEHTVSDLETWDDHQLEGGGPPYHPMRWDATDKYVPVSGMRHSRRSDANCGAQPRAARFFTLRPRFARDGIHVCLFARMYGTNNLPDSSNMCHETTSVALPESIGVPVGTCTLDDFKHTDGIFFFGQNVGTRARACCIDCRRRQNVACRSSPSIPSASADWSSSSIRNRRRKCW